MMRLLARTRGRRGLQSAFLAPMLLLLAGCGGGHQATPRVAATATTAPRPPGTSPAASPIPAPPTATVNAEQARQAGIADGKVLFQAQCAACHALADAGIAPAPHPIAPSLDHVGAHFSQTALRAELLDACAHPLPSHPAYACKQAHGFVAFLTPPQRDEIVAYLLSLR